MPEIMALVIQKTTKTGVFFDLINLDEFCIDGVDKEAVIKYYLTAIEKYGENNVRLVDIKDVRITRQADF